MRPVKWQIDEITCVKIEPDDGCDTLHLMQGEDCVLFEKTGTSVTDAVIALLSAIEASDFDFPDLERFGFIHEDDA
jgi:hypothetical protein